MIEETNELIQLMWQDNLSKSGKWNLEEYIIKLRHYQKAWQELVNLYRVTFKDTMSKNDYAVLYRLEEIEKRHNLGGE